MIEKLFDRYNDKDENGNELKVDTNGFVHLHLKNQPVRNIGRLMKQDSQTLYVKHEKTKDVFRKAMAWGLCWNLLSKLNNDDEIVIYSDDNRTWKISKVEAIAYGSFLFFKKQGLEKRFFVPLKYWKVTNG